MKTNSLVINRNKTKQKKRHDTHTCIHQHTYTPTHQASVVCMWEGGGGNNAERTTERHTKKTDKRVRRTHTRTDAHTHRHIKPTPAWYLPSTSCPAVPSPSPPLACLSWPASCRRGPLGLVACETSAFSCEVWGLVASFPVPTRCRCR